MATVTERLARLEAALAALSAEVVTGRLVVTDADGTPRLLAGVDGPTVQLQLVVPGAPGSDASVVLHASNPDAELGALAGIQLWAAGDLVLELDMWPDNQGRWRPHVHIGGP